MVIALSVPPPRNWQDFERLCADLWRRLWNDPYAQANGRQGQAQHGVDIVGRVNGTDAYAAVQCKGKDQSFGQPVTIQELHAEIAKAMTFRPALTHFVLATTTPNDAALQMEARLITAEHLKRGLFTVDVLGWDEILIRLADYPEVVSKHFPNLASVALDGFEPVDASTVGGVADPRKFFLGWKPTFADLKAEIDVRRTLDIEGAETSYELFKDRLVQECKTAHLYALFGEGGTGKTTFLRRLALDLADAAFSVYRAVLGAQIRTEHVIRYAKNRPETPTFLVVDDAQSVAKQLLNLQDELRLFPNKTVVIAGSRRNEWNIAVRPLRASGFLTVHLALLSRAETEALIANLARVDALGQLSSLSHEKQIEALMVAARRQLLAGLLEATHGAGFREIVRNEYDSIDDERAQFLYIGSCLMQRLSILLPMSVARAITLTTDPIRFDADIMTRLELVVQIEEAQLGTILAPRHRNISSELLSQLCPTTARQFDVALRVLQRLRTSRRDVKPFQSVAVRVGERMLSRDLISTDEDAYAMAEAVLGAGTNNYSLGTQISRHELRPQLIGHAQRGARMYQIPADHPGPKQFLVAARIVRQHGGLDEGIRVLSEGLRIRADWHLLSLSLAQYKFEQGDVETAEALVARVLNAHRSGRSGPVRLSLSLATALMKLRQNDDPQMALEYLELADRALHKGMTDPDGYFTARAGLLRRLGRPLDAVKILERALALVVAPKWVVTAIEREYASLLATHNVERFREWVQGQIAAGVVIPTHTLKFIIDFAVVERDADTVKALVAQHPNILTLVMQLTNLRLNSDDLDGVRFLSELFLPIVPIGKKVFFKLFKPEIVQRDSEALRAALSRTADRTEALRTLVRHYARNGDASENQFLIAFAREEGLFDDAKPIDEASRMEALRGAVEVGNDDRAKALFESLRANRSFLRLYLDVWRYAEADLLQRAEEVLEWRMPLHTNAASKLAADAIIGTDFHGAMDVLRRAWDFREVVPSLQGLFTTGPQKEVMERILANVAATDEPAEDDFPRVPYLVHYRAVGEIQGILSLSAGTPSRGRIIRGDGSALGAYWEKKLDVGSSGRPGVWIGYPMDLDGKLEMLVVSERMQSTQDGVFSIRGEVVSIDDSVVRVTIRRNPPLTIFGDTRSVRLIGQLPETCAGWFVSFRAMLRDGELHINRWTRIIACDAACGARATTRASRAT